ncbi:hypothetical protein H2199_007058 [Coniosporium tulheliwenetii]|uniref:Uncharacterized protein n=1 Tax=Coniosporium tulheliwenetii TaxID=3383036 RepID=A0ACC2YSI3_9PEZI|nr:hypothetical protein H2199_007058 [Cladosporium sp. JES 115]
MEVPQHPDPPDHDPKSQILRWAPPSSQESISSRFLLGDGNNVHVYDIRDTKWCAHINNGSGGAGKIMNAEFGRTEDEVLLFSDFSARFTVWSLTTGRSVEIKDPKFASTRSFGLRPGNGVLALLSRPGPQDILTLHAPSSHAVIKTVQLQTADAQGLKWSPDGRWLAVWDAPSVGFKIHIFTADGHLYREWNGEVVEGIVGLGVKSLEWSPRGDFLAIGGFDRRVTLLSTRTQFSAAVFLDHTPTIQLAVGDVWQEQVSATSERRYTIAAQPVSPPKAPSPANDGSPKSGISIIVFNAEGTFVATRDDSTPTTVWLWNLTRLAPQTVLIQHSPIKHLSWHPTKPHLLLVQCTHDDSTVYVWDSLKAAPEALSIPSDRPVHRLEARWLSTTSDKKPCIVLGDATGYVLAWPEGRDAILRFEHPSTPGVGDESEDSLYEILTGKKSVPDGSDTVALADDAWDEDESLSLDDTFHGRGNAGSKERHDLSTTSSLAECF